MGRVRDVVRQDRLARWRERSADIVALPVFRLARVPPFRDLRRQLEDPQPKDLEGKRVGIPEWAQTAGIYVRGLLQHEYGVDLARIEWRQAGVRQPGRVEKVELRLPPGVKHPGACRSKTLAQMLAAGELDAVISARDPGGHAPVRQLPRARGRVLPQDAHLPDHACRGAAARSLRARPLDRDEPLQGIRGGEERAAWSASRRSACRTCRCPGSPITRGSGRSSPARTSGPTASSRTGRRWKPSCSTRFEQGVAHARLKAEELFAPETLETRTRSSPA